MSLSQNKKIAISALAIFMVSFSALLFFLSNADPQLVQGHTSVIHPGGGSTSNEHGFPYEIVDKNCEDCLDGESSEGQNMLIISPEGELLNLTETFCEFSGYKCEDLEGNSLFEYIDEKSLPKFTAYHSKIIQDGETKKGAGPYKILNEDGKPLLVLFDICPVLGKKDKVEKIVIFVRDITETVKEIENANSEESTEKTWLERVYPRQMADLS